MTDGRERTLEQLRAQLERAYDELAGWRARETDGQSTAQALHDAEQLVAALLDENRQLSAQLQYMKKEALPNYKRRLDEARDAAEHLWFYGQEHGVSDEEARDWYPWLYELHEQKLADREAAAPRDQR